MTQGLDEERVRRFLATKGAYCADSDLIAHCIKLGKLYHAPSFFDPKDEEELMDDRLTMRA